jgi:hypothetical protein
MDTAAAPPALVQVAQHYLQTSRGIVGFTLHRVLDVHAGFSRRHEDIVMHGIYEDGKIVRVHIVSYTIDGKTASDPEQIAMAQAYEDPKPGQRLALPFDPANFSQYTYQQAGPQMIGFTSSVRDAGHGSGSLTYDAADNIVSYTYAPNALPPHASAGTVVDRRSQVLPDYWAVIQETQQYQGSYGPFPGAATEQVDFSDFSRFPDLQSALRSI